MSTTPLLHSFVEDELSRTPLLVQRVLGAVLSSLGSRPDPRSSLAERRLEADLLENLRQKSSWFARGFEASLRGLVMAELDGRDQQSTTPSNTEFGGFHLVDEGRVESDIAISRAAQTIDNLTDWEARELQTFTSALSGKDHVSADSNPLRPMVYARALWEATGSVTAIGGQRQLLLRVTAEPLAGQLKLAWAAACSRLEARGVEPSVYRTTNFPVGSTVDRLEPFRITPQRIGQLLSRMPADGVVSGPRIERRARIDRRVSGSDRTGDARPAPQFEAAFEQALQRIEVLLNGRPAEDGMPPVSSRGLAQPLLEHHGSLQMLADDLVDRQTIELLFRLFEAMLGDAEVPAAARAVIARFQVSALRVALNDPSMVESDEHPVWQLLNRIASASRLWPQAGDPRLARLVEFSEQLAGDIAATSQPTPELYASGLERLVAHLEDQLQSQRKAASAAIDALMLTDTRETLRTELSQQFSEQFRSSRASHAVLAFMEQTWVQVVTESVLRYGGEDAHTAAYLQMADDLRWTLSGRIEAHDRQRLFAMLPRLLKCMREGMTLIGLPEPEQSAAVDALMACHTDLLGFGSRAHAEEGSMGSESQLGSVEPFAAPSAVIESVDALIDLDSMETVPAELLSRPEGAQTLSAAILENIVLAQPCEWFIHGHWQRVQLLWRSESARFFLFAGETAGCPHPITGSALERLSEAGLIKPIAESALLQRAIESVGKQLSKPA